MTIDLQNAPGLDTREWNEPEGIGPRGTLIVLVGRGETGAVYRRFGSRIAADAYRVRTVVDVVNDPVAARDRVLEVLADESLPSPKVLVGSDTGAAFALELAAEGVAADALVVAGLPTVARGQDGDWQAELEARTACPAHRGVLGRAATQGALWSPIPTELLGVVSSGVAVPVLAIHGSDDTVSNLDAALSVYAKLPHHEIVTVAGGRHDILNDVTHRSVAATIVLFLERLRLDPTLAPIVETR
jgi:alpha-beta hydrolase superfamily lysophospholipase